MADEPTTAKPPVVFIPRISIVSNQVPTPTQERIQAFFKRQKELAKELIPKPIVIPPIGDLPLCLYISILILCHIVTCYFYIFLWKCCIYLHSSSRSYTRSNCTEREGSTPIISNQCSSISSSSSCSA